MKEHIDILYKKNDIDDSMLLKILLNNDKKLTKYLFQKARETKERYYGNAVYMRGLIEFSNICKQNCFYCGIRKDNKKVDRYRLTDEQILLCCEEGYELGYRTFVMQSGEDPYFTDDILVDIIKKIKSKYKDAAITLSIGERTFESYKKLYEAGTDRFLLRHETASKELYDKLHSGMDFENRRKCLLMLKKLGYQVGAGFMVGLPGQENEDLVKDLRYLKELEPHMIGIGPFIPHKETPLGFYEGGTVEKTLIMLALTRLLLPKVLLPSTTALGTIDNKGREKALQAGANVVMPNLSPTNVREKYELYQNKICTGDEAAHCRVCIERRIETTGYKVDMGRGDYFGFS